MGQEIEQSEFSEGNYEAFAKHLKSEMDLLRTWFAGEKFCDDRLQCGLELEAWLIGGNGYPVPDNALFLQTLERKCVVPELSRFNFEVNVSPQYLAGNGLRDMRLELGATWRRCQAVAEKMGDHVLSIGILPTVSEDMLSIQNMSPLQRYAALNRQVLKMRDGMPLTLAVEGKDSLQTVHQSLMLEAAATSLQVHLKVPQRSAVRYYNASILASSFTCAMAANAPLLFGRHLWDDTRITVFEQAVDTRGQVPRVSFGQNYASKSLLENFESNLSRPVLLPAQLDEPTAQMPYVRMHNGTLWNWNRPLIGFERDGQPHLRIEHRPMSASPTLGDLFADVSLYLGLVNYLANLQEPPEQAISFEAARRNFYRAAKYSFDAELEWLGGKTCDLTTLLRDGLLEDAMDWLSVTGASSHDIDIAHDILAQRLQEQQNGARWQVRKFYEWDRDVLKLQEAYTEQQATGRPVHEWN